MMELHIPELEELKTKIYGFTKGPGRQLIILLMDYCDYMIRYLDDSWHKVDPKNSTGLANLQGQRAAYLAFKYFLESYIRPASDAEEPEMEPQADLG